MKKKIIKNGRPRWFLLFVLCQLLLPVTSSSQSGGQPVVLTVFSEAARMPYSALLQGPVHPGMAVGTEFSWKENKHFRLYPSVSAGYMFHRRLFQGFFINAELGVDYKTNSGLVLKAKIGSGYLRSYTLHTKYVIKDGVYISQKDKGRSRFMPSLTTGAGYRFDPQQPRSPELFLLYQTWIEFPYSPGFIPLLPHTNLCIGTRFYTDKKTDQK